MRNSSGDKVDVIYVSILLLAKLLGSALFFSMCKIVVLHDVRGGGATRKALCGFRRKRVLSTL